MSPGVDRMDSQMGSKSSTTREHIANAAIRVLADHGLDGLTSARIAAEAGCAKGLINYHYPGRPDLWRAVVPLVVDQICQPRTRALAGVGAGVVDATWQALLEQRDRQTWHTWLAVMAWYTPERKTDPTIRLAMESAAARWAAAVRKWLERSGFTGADPADIAPATWALLDGFAMALTRERSEGLYPSYLTAWLGLIAVLSEARS